MSQTVTNHNQLIPVNYFSGVGNVSSKRHSRLSFTVLILRDNANERVQALSSLSSGVSDSKGFGHLSRIRRLSC